MKICIFGAGASARETYWIVKRCGHQVEALLDVRDGTSYDTVPILDENYFDPEKHLGVIAIGNSLLRKQIVERITNKYGPVFISVIDPSVIILSPNVKIGVGAVIAPGCVITSDIEIGNYCQINVGTSIMHDVHTGDYFTTAPGVRINGRVNIGHIVTFGSNSSTKEHISICDNVVIGAGACVVKDISESGTYVGIPARQMKGIV
jgi:sugar O-acyltransferase (sialic acid O-acetyltransferase NeuD family)